MSCTQTDKDIVILIEHLESRGLDIGLLLNMHIQKICNRLEGGNVEVKEFTVTGGGDEDLNKMMRDAIKSAGLNAMKPKMPKPSKPIKEGGGLISNGPDVPTPAGPIRNEPDFTVRPPTVSYGNACEHCYTETESLFHFIAKKRCNHCGRNL